jgi:hypothetical protein
MRTNPCDLVGTDSGNLNMKEAYAYELQGRGGVSVHQRCGGHT